jgi:hypothetical protein
MSGKSKRIAFGIKVLSILAAACSFSGCAAVRNMICDCDKSCDDKPSHCENCGTIASCAAPAGMYGTPYMGDSQMQNMGSAIPMPTPDMQVPPMGVQSEAEQWAPKSTWLPPAQQQSMPMTASAAANCEAQLQQAKAELDAKLNALEDRVENERQAKNSLYNSLETVNGEVARLSRELEFWRDEVRRIEHTTAMQHQSDMESLSSISRMIDNIAPVSASSSSR